MTIIPIVLVGVAAIIDLRRREIPDWISVAILLMAVFQGINGTPAAGLNRLAAFLIAFWLGSFLFALGAWGGGDVKLLSALGAWLGFSALVTALFWMALAGGVLAVVAAIRCQRTFAYGPAIGFGAICALLDVERLLRLVSAGS
ncbi:MAG: conserved rane protein of unknown function [Planctomycetaceae bacterium]|nr:conserved rane protein of unknown function [Planctomycetaceae bacterium]